MDSKLKKIVEEGRELIQATPDLDDPKRKVLLNRAKKAVDTFEIVMEKLILRL